MVSVRSARDLLRRTWARWKVAHDIGNFQARVRGARAIVIIVAQSSAIAPFLDTLF